jgi:hypothetical protein
MKKLCISIITTVLSTMVFAQSTKLTIDRTLVCDDTKKIVNELMRGDYKEVPIWGGLDESTKFMVLANSNTGTWTIIQFTPGIACLLGAGDGSKLLTTDSKKQSM